jgi:hypothetical protein
MSNNKPLSQINADMEEKGRKIAAAIDTTIPVLVGEMLVDGFQKSFDLQKFNDEGAQPWKEVERRKQGSEWYGFNYKSNASVGTGARGYRPNGRPRRYGTRGGITNFTQTASTRSILLGWGSANLRGSIFLYEAKRGRVIVASDQPHAAVHNEGLEAEIFGKKAFKMPQD